MAPGALSKSPSVANDYRIRPNEKKMVSCFRLVLFALYLIFLIVYPILFALQIASHPDKQAASGSIDSPAALYVPWLCLFGTHLLFMCPSVFFCSCSSTLESLFLTFAIAGISVDLSKFSSGLAEKDFALILINYLLYFFAWVMLYVLLWLEE